jgi:hypothetical protein
MSAASAEFATRPAAIAPHAATGASFAYVPSADPRSILAIVARISYLRTLAKIADFSQR